MERLKMGDAWGGASTQQVLQNWSVEIHIYKADFRLVQATVSASCP